MIARTSGTPTVKYDQLVREPTYNVRTTSDFRRSEAAAYDGEGDFGEKMVDQRAPATARQCRQRQEPLSYL